EGACINAVACTGSSICPNRLPVSTLLLRGRGWNRGQVPQLAEDCHVVPRYPYLRELANLYTQDSPEVHPDLLSGRWERPHLPRLCTLIRSPCRRQVSLCEEV